MKNRFTIASGLCLFVAVATSTHAENIPDLALHANQSLNGKWRIIVDPYETGFYDYRYRQRDKSPQPSRADTYFLDVKPVNSTERIEYDFDRSPTLDVPGDWNTQRPDLFYYEGSVWYRRTFDAPVLQNGERAFLRFGAANYRADAYLNGQKLGVHVGGFTPFSFDVTSWLRPGTNSLVVKVDNKRSRHGVPTLNTDWWNYGGLTRSVTLVRTPARFIADHRLWLDSELDNTIAGFAVVDGAHEGDAVELTISELNVRQIATVDAGSVARFKFKVEGLTLWDPERPKLYDVTFSCGADELTDPIGFRTIRTRGKQVLLNGRPLFLRGISIHEEFSINGGGRVNSACKAKQLLSWAKELNCNFVRLAHYPHNEDMIRLCDQMGLLVWSEVPVYWTIDWQNRATYRNAERQLTDMIRRDANRACIIIWSLANETPNSQARTDFLSRLASKARTLDGTRLLSAALEKHGKPDAPGVNVVEDPLAEQIDIVAFNEYIGWYDGLPEKCATMSFEVPYDKPVFVSEFGAGALQGLHGDKSQRWTEDYQADVYQKTLPMLDSIDGFVGCTPWILMDFRSPRRVLPGIQDGFNRKGLISSEGIKKDAFYVLREYYRRRLHQVTADATNDPQLSESRHSRR